MSETASTYVETRTVPLDELSFFPGNAKQHDLDTITASLARNGQYRPLVVREIPNGPLVALAGNGTLEALQLHGPGTCPPQQAYQAADEDTRKTLRPCALCMDGTWDETARVEIHHCDDDQARRINLVDNRAQELGTYDHEALAALFDPLDGDLDGTGYTPQDVKDITALLDLPPDEVSGLADGHAEPDDDAFQPEIHIKVTAATMDRWRAALDAHDGDDDGTKLLALLDEIEQGRAARP